MRKWKTEEWGGGKALHKRELGLIGGEKGRSSVPSFPPALDCRCHCLNALKVSSLGDLGTHQWLSSTAIPLLPSLFPIKKKYWARPLFAGPAG